MELTGGNVSGAVRIGDTVHRDAGPWTPTVHRLLRHLSGLGVPTPLGYDDGRETVSWVDGVVPQDPMPAWVWTDAVLAAAARLLRRLHDATLDFDRDGAVWRRPAREPAEVICHGDFAPYNLVFAASQDLIGVIDWDMASPGPRVWDLGYLAYRTVPLSAPSNPDLLHSGQSERERRVALLCAAYGGVSPSAVLSAAVLRLHDLASFTAARAAAGATHVAPHVQLYEDDAVWLEEFRQTYRP